MDRKAKPTPTAPATRETTTAPPPAPRKHSAPVQAYRMGNAVTAELGKQADLGHTLDERQKQWAQVAGKAQISEGGNIVRAGEQELYASKEAIDSANQALAKAGQGGSWIALAPKEKYVVDSLYRVEPVFADRGRQSSVMNPLAEANDPHRQDTYQQRTKERTAPYEKAQDDAGHGEVKKPIHMSANVALTVRAHLSKRQLTMMGSSEPIKLSDQQAEAIAKDLGEIVQEIQDLRQDKETGKLVLWKHCITSAYAVMGIVPTSETRAIFKDENGKEQQTFAAASDGGVKRWAQEIYDFIFNTYHEAIWGGLWLDGLDYSKQTPQEQRALDKEFGFNTGANPEIGEGYTIIPNQFRKDYQPNPCGTWTYHWAGVIMKDGEDNATLENAAAMGLESDRAWHFEMYGTKTDGQSFHDAWFGGGRFGNSATTMVVRPEGPSKSTQLKESGDALPTPDLIQQHATEGVASAASRLPHLDQIQRSFGVGHDVSDVRAQIGGPAESACRDIGAEAYATGNSVAFGSAPSVFVAAHEAAHVVQQRGGVQLLGGVGQVGDAHELHADAVAERVVRGESAVDLLGASAPAGPGGQVATQRHTGPVQMIPVKIAGKHLDSEDDLDTDTDSLDETQARAVIDNKHDYAPEQVEAAQKRLEKLIGSTSKLSAKATQVKRPPSRKVRSNVTTSNVTTSNPNTSNVNTSKGPTPVIDWSQMKREPLVGRLKVRDSLPPQKIPVVLQPVVLPNGTLTLQLIQQQPRETNEAPIMLTDFAFVPTPTAAPNLNDLRTVVMFRIVENGQAYKYPTDSTSAPLNDMMTDADPQLGVEEGWVMDIDPGVDSTNGSLARRDLRREKSQDTEIAPFYGNSGTATEYKYQTDQKVGYVDTPSFMPAPGGTMTYHYQVVITNTGGGGTSVGAPVATASWSFDIVNSNLGICSIQNVTAPQASGGSGTAQEGARFTSALEKFDSYYKNPSGHTKPISFDANHFVYCLGSVPLNAPDRELASLLAQLADPPTAGQIMTLVDKCQAYLETLELEAPTDTNGLVSVKLKTVKELLESAKRPLDK